MIKLIKVFMFLIVRFNFYTGVADQWYNTFFLYLLELKFLISAKM